MSHDCAAHVQYFIEANTKDSVWFGVAQQKDNLRVRPPYHPESPCQNVHFKGQFDIGQLDVDNIEAGIEVYTPFIANVYNDPETDWVAPEKEEPEEPQECAPPLVNNIDPVHKAHMDLLSFFFEERIMADLIIWLPGIFFLYSSMCEERNQAMQLLVTLIQSLVITIGIYNLLISALPLDMLKDPSELRHIQMVAFSVIFCVTIVVLNFKEVTEFFLKLALVCFIPDIVFWKMVVVMYTKERMHNFKLIYVAFFIVIGLASLYCVLKIVIEAYRKEKSLECESSDDPAKVTRKRKNKKVKAVKEEVPTTQPNIKVEGQKTKSEAKSPGSSNIAAVATCSKKVKENGSLTSTLLDQKGSTSAKGRNRSKKISQASQGRSSSETSSSSSSDYPEKSRDQKFCQDSLQSSSKAPTKVFAAALPDLNQKKTALQCKENPTNNQIPGLSKECQPKEPKPLTHLDPTSHESSLVDHLVQQYCAPQNADPSCNLPQKSKILTIIRENNHQDDNPRKVEETEKERSGFLLGSRALPSPSDALVFVPGQPIMSKPTVPSPSKTELVEKKTRTVEVLTSPTLEYKCGDQTSVGDGQPAKEEGFTEKVANRKPVADIPQTITSPLTRILIKEINNFPAGEVDRATKEILLHTNIEDLTIPQFQKLVMEKLQQEKNKEIYISSDEDEEDDECHICLASLDEELEVLEGCGHVFHVSCIASWVARKESEKISASCPKCRAKI